MSACCHAAERRKSPSCVRRAREIFAWTVPGALLVLVPKCPVCLAAYVMLWTGIGLSVTTAAYLRWAMLLLGIGSLMFLVVVRLNQIVGAIASARNRKGHAQVEP